MIYVSAQASDIEPVIISGPTDDDGALTGPLKHTCMVQEGGEQPTWKPTPM